MKLPTPSRLLLVAIAFFVSTAVYADAPGNTPTSPAQSIQLTRDKVATAIEHYAAADAEAAAAAALSAHVDAFEFVEPALSTASPALLSETEEALDDVGGVIDRGGSMAELQSAAARLAHELDEVQELLGQATLTGREAGVASYLILLREGVEAVLVLAAIAAFLRRTDRASAIPYIHGGWIGALVLGGVTWFAATELIQVSGANRELAEGVTALLAAGMLLYVGFWLHNGTNARRWSQFVGAKLDGAAASQSIWPLILVAFLAVYREVFETVLFTQTLWLQVATAERHFVLLGLGAAALTLVLVSWAVFRMSIKLPLKPFFAANAVLLVILAVVFTGKGIMALEEAGVVPLKPVAFPEISLLGIYPDLTGLIVQALIVLSVLAFVWFSRNGGLKARQSH